ncbi:MAG TPA: hypothetical protein DEH22_05130 [Chloroflexi bacterium]|nr:hypothetical protein [Chloroflexota bacterium]
MNELERDWRAQAFGENQFLAASQDLMPWLVLLGVVLLGPLILLIRRKTRD